MTHTIVGQMTHSKEGDEQTKGKPGQAGIIVAFRVISLEAKPK